MGLVSGVVGQMRPMVHFGGIWTYFMLKCINIHLMITYAVEMKALSEQTRNELLPKILRGLLLCWWNGYPRLSICHALFCKLRDSNSKS
jgi:hypothetical protein